MLLALLAGSMAATGAVAQATADHAPTQRVREDMQSTLSHMAQAGALGPDPAQASLTVDEPGRRVAMLGAVVNSTSAQSARDGLVVLGTTPGTTADRLGLRAGDRIVAVNGTSLRNLGADARGRALAASTLRTVVEGLPDAATIRMDVERSGAPMTLAGPLTAVYVPPMHVQIGGDAGAAAGAVEAGCGRISQFDVAPRGERLYGVRILLLDGRTPGPEGTSSFRVSAGEHRLVVAENIPTEAFGIGEFATRRRNTSKPLVVTVHPGQTALVAAQLHRDRAGSINDGRYWDPVVWKEVAESCR
jgi:hypothetical protein